MDQQRFRLGGRGALMLAIAAAFPLAAHGAPAARVEFAVGNPTAQGPSGQVRPLAKGAEVGQGDTVNTGDGRVQLRFVDGAYVSLQPQSQFRIDEFRFNGQQDGTEKGFFSLLKGGLRTITGLVGRNNKGNYQVTTTVATIGIRGTEYTIVYGKSITGSVGEGEIRVCNTGGCLNVTNGESYYVRGADVRPQLSDKKVDLPPPPLQAAPSNFVQGENRNVAGDPISFILTGTQDVNVAFIKSLGSLEYGSSTWVFDAAGAARKIDTCFDGCEANWAAPVLEQGNDGIIAWGRWTGNVATNDFGSVAVDLTSGSLHYVAGLPTSSTELATLNSGALRATYALLGGTAPTWSGGGVAGALTAASLTADFGTLRATGSVSVNIGGVAYSGTNIASISSSSGQFSVFSFAGSSPGALNFAGFFAGANAIRAGMAYELYVTGDSVHGAAAFAQTGLTNSSGVAVRLP
jgi:hypothetical protein